MSKYRQLFIGIFVLAAVQLSAEGFMSLAPSAWIAVFAVLLFLTFNIRNTAETNSVRLFSKGRFSFELFSLSERGNSYFNRNKGEKVNLRRLALIGIFGICCGVIIYIFVAYAPVSIKKLTFISSGKWEMSFIFIIIRTVIAAAIYEELIYRRLLIVFFLSVTEMSFMAANLLQALLFGILHGGLLQGCYSFLFGIAAGLLYKKTKCIEDCIILHMITNLTLSALYLASGRINLI